MVTGTAAVVGTTASGTTMIEAMVKEVIMIETTTKEVTTKGIMAIEVTARGNEEAMEAMTITTAHSIPITTRQALPAR